ncbi:two component transcriptional regulator, LytTR family [Flavobacterium sp. CF108]|uniref:LytR/AlgR family response regulator transcription factor n=1 Tax=unclassified Flavobacterium TaxID=196869 RepID=UPI0008B99B7C|nr:MULTISPECIES: LytTR family DNA-binding domain-containing protein [unclassified Flavobacterium]SEO20221.1 two component transcriptional regulator, LytTR family [Flavobacterium sp. fv08]SHG52902.1 two component transcriptional regulator, LytTR family [Flavobacterium sp. CF108]
MKILIIEDEARIAKRIERMTRDFFDKEVQILLSDSVENGLNTIEKQSIDLLLLDLNLNGEDGFEVLQTVVAKSFQTIIISAYTDKAIMAFNYGVLDFVPKPFDENRLAQAFTRFTTPEKTNGQDIQFLAVKKGKTIKLITIKDIMYIKGAGIYTELHLVNGRVELHDKSLESLEKLLPTDFERIHKSYILCWQEADKLIVEAGGKYNMLLKNGELLPVGRSKYKEIRHKLI